MELQRILKKLASLPNFFTENFAGSKCSLAALVVEFPLFFSGDLHQLEPVGGAEPFYYKKYNMQWHRAINTAIILESNQSQISR